MRHLAAGKALSFMAKPALPELRLALDDEDAAVRTEVKMAIQRIDGP